VPDKQHNFDFVLILNLLGGSLDGIPREEEEICEDYFQWLLYDSHS